MGLMQDEVNERRDRALDRMRWQPIDTAPRDEQPILVWDGSSFDVVYEAWQDNQDNPVWFNGDVVVKATHWMPLPSAPE